MDPVGGYHQEDSRREERLHPRGDRKVGWRPHSRAPLPPHSLRQLVRDAPIQISSRKKSAPKATATRGMEPREPASEVRPRLPAPPDPRSAPPEQATFAPGHFFFLFSYGI